MTTDEAFRHMLRVQVRDLFSWHPKEVTHCSVTGRHPETGELWTAYGKRESSADLSVWVRRGTGGEPEEEERSLAR